MEKAEAAELRLLLERVLRLLTAGYHPPPSSTRLRILMTFAHDLDLVLGVGLWCWVAGLGCWLAGARCDSARAPARSRLRYNLPCCVGSNLQYPSKSFGRPRSLFIPKSAPFWHGKFVKIRARYSVEHATANARPLTLSRPGPPG